jgi:solute:Na+ symporter, SSS family
MHVIRPNSLDIMIVCGYFAVTLLIGYLTRRNSESSTQYLNASRAMPLWVAALSFLAVNLSGTEIVGLSAMSAEYGVSTLHFYWIGAIPAMIFLALFMIPIYLRSRAHSVPEFLHLRFNSQTRLLNSISLLIISALFSGISLYAMAVTLHCFLGWSFLSSALVGGLLALIFLVLGGLRATIYNEILQLTIIVAGLAPLAFLVLVEFHGIRGLLASLPQDMSHLWAAMPLVSSTTPMDGIGVAMGLGFVLSFGYWCTDYRLIQRALTTQDRQETRLVPLIAAAGKLIIPLLVIVPGLAAYRLLYPSGYGAVETSNYDQALPLMIRRYYAHGLFGLGIEAILASLMSGLASNVAAFSSLWTQEIYRPYLAVARPEKHYIFVGRISMAVGVLASVAAAFIALRFRNLMDYIQFLFALFNAPLLAIFLLGMFTKWTTPWGGFWGLLIGILVGVLHNISARAHWLHDGSQMSSNFYGAIYAWSAATIVTVVISTFTARKAKSQLDDLVFELTPIKACFLVDRPIWSLALLLAVACLVLNMVFC